MQPDNRDPKPAAEADALGGLIRAAGRRAAPPDEHYASVRAASLAAWQAKVAQRRLRRQRYALAASVFVALSLIGALRLLTPVSADGVARAVLVSGDVAAFSTRTGRWAPLEAGAAALEAGDRVRTGLAAGAAFELDGEVSLRVGAGTELTLTAGTALALAAGSVYLDSGDGLHMQAFEITTPYGVVSDIGTQFEVASNDTALRVRVRAGAVRLSGSDLVADTGGTAGEEIELTAGGDLERRPFAPHDAGWDWVQALAVAPAAGDASVREYLSWISKETGRPLRYDSIATETRAGLEHFRGNPKGLKPLDLLESITATTDFEHVIEADGAILIRRNATAP